MPHRRLLFATLLLAVLLLAAPAVRADAARADAGPDLRTQAGLTGYLLTWMLPLGVALLAVGVSQPSRAFHVATSLPLALAVACAGYALCGFAIQFGGLGVVSADPAFADWVAEWSPLDLVLGDGWGLLGLRGFALSDSVMSPAAWNLFLAQLPLVTTAALLPLVTLAERIPRLPALGLALLVAALLYPLMGNWVRGGGWLSQLGHTMRLGQGYRDDGLASLHLVGAGAAWAALVGLRRTSLRRPRISEPELPRAYLPLSLMAGALVATLGWVSALLTPSVGPALDPLVVLPRLLAALAGGVLGGSFYGWLVRGKPDTALTGRAMLASLVVVSACIASLPVWLAALSGAMVGLLLAPVMYLVERWGRLDDLAATISVHGCSAIVGLLMAAALGGGLQQLYAQLIGVGALLVVSALLPWALLALVAHAFTLPAAVGQAARERAAERAQVRQLRVRARLQGAAPTLWQRLNRAYRRRAAAAKRRLMARPNG